MSLGLSGDRLNMSPSSLIHVDLPSSAGDKILPSHDELKHSFLSGIERRPSDHYRRRAVPEYLLPDKDLNVGLGQPRNQAAVISEQTVRIRAPTLFSTMSSARRRTVPPP